MTRDLNKRSFKDLLKRSLKAKPLPTVFEQLLLFAAVGGMKDTDAMSALHIADEIITLDTDTEWTHYTQPNVPHSMKHNKLKRQDINKVSSGFSTVV